MHTEKLPRGFWLLRGEVQKLDSGPKPEFRCTGNISHHFYIKKHRLSCSTPPLEYPTECTGDPSHGHRSLLGWGSTSRMQWAHPSHSPARQRGRNSLVCRHGASHFCNGTWVRSLYNAARVQKYLISTSGHVVSPMPDCKFILQSTWQEYNCSLYSNNL